VFPANQRFCTAGRAAEELNFWLKMNNQFVALQCAAKVVDDSELAYVVVLTTVFVGDDCLILSLGFAAGYGRLAQKVCSVGRMLREVGELRLTFQMAKKLRARRDASSTAIPWTDY
jgi:hypothetical protein